MRAIERTESSSNGKRLYWLTRSGTIDVRTSPSAVLLFLIVMFGGCAPTYREIVVRSPTPIDLGGEVLVPDASESLSLGVVPLGSKVRITTLAGNKIEGLLIAAGDSIAIAPGGLTHDGLLQIAADEIRKADVQVTYSSADRALALLGVVALACVVAASLLLPWYE